MLLRALLGVGLFGLLGAAAPALARHDDTVECRSSGYKYNECEADFRRPRLVQQLSDTECVVNENWGYNRDNGAIWVSKGCAGVFGDSDGRDNRDRREDRRDRDDYPDRGRGGPPPRRGREEVTECKSRGYAFTRCDGEWSTARLLEQLSAASCVEDQTWGVDEDGLWVDKGCGGRFAGQ